ncbi:MAG: hypothetical protein AAFY02_04955 [Pseudomonadota bacterium]
MNKTAMLHSARTAPRGRAWRGLLCTTALLFALAACKQLGAPAPGQGTVDSNGEAVIASAAAGSVATTPGSLPGSPLGANSLQQALASNQSFATLVDLQGVSWSVEIGPAYDAASGKTCKPLRFVALSRNDGPNRVACSDGGVWQLIPALRSTQSGPRF